MNCRKMKKVAKRYLDTGYIPARFVLGVEEWTLHNPEVYVKEMIVPARIRRAIYTEAYRRGWDGCHWRDPLREFDFAEQR